MFLVMILILCFMYLFFAQFTLHFLDSAFLFAYFKIKALNWQLPVSPTSDKINN